MSVSLRSGQLVQSSVLAAVSTIFLAMGGCSLAAPQGTPSAPPPDQPAQTRPSQPPAILLPSVELSATPAAAATATAIRITASPAALAATPTSTAVPIDPEALNPDGPWLVGVTRQGQLIGLNPDGSGLTGIWRSPLIDRYPDLQAAAVISQSGWIAARTSLSTWPSPPADISLDIFRLPGTEPMQRIALFSDELVARMEERGEYPVPDANYTVTGPAWQNELVYLTVLSERNSPRWSPEGRYLAFAAAIDGLSSDIYVYDTRTDRVQRLTSGANQAVIMGWSPDSRWIVHAEVSSTMIADGGEIGGFPADTVWAASADGAELKRIYQPGRVEFIEGWLSNTVFVVNQWSGYIFLHDLRTVDLNASTERMRWAGRFYTSAVAPAARMAVIDVVGEFTAEEDYPPVGLHLVPLDGRPPRQLFPGNVEVNAAWIDWFAQLNRFLAGGFSAPYFFTPAGEIGPTFENERGRPAVSPDGSWLMFDKDRDRPGLRLYRPDATLVREVSDEQAFNLVWTPDSSSLYYLVREGDAIRLMAASIPDGEPIVVHPNPGFSWFVLVEGS